MMRSSSIILAVWAKFIIAAASTTCTYPPLYSATLEELTSGLLAGCFTSVDLVRAYIARIEEVNDELHAVIELNPDALSIADNLDYERANGTTRGPLHGLPVLVKDTIATFDQMSNTAGSYALVGAKVARDSSVIKKLREGGAILLGKTNLSQWAMFRSGNGTSGWSSVGGQAYGPYYPNQDPSGSSSGSGVAAGIGLSFAALGTETRGSILEPAGRSNVVGIKPSVGLTSRYLVVPVTSFQDTVGPLARTVLDAAAVLSVIAGIDENDNATSFIPDGGKIPDYFQSATENVDLQGTRIGIARNGFSSELLSQQANKTVILASFEQAVNVLRGLGAEIVDQTNFSALAISTFLHSLGTPNVTNETISCSAGFNSGLVSYLSELTYNPNNLHNLSDLINYTKLDPREDYPDRNIVTWEGAIQLGYNETDIRAIVAHNDGIDVDYEGGVTGILRKYNLSALIIPTAYAPTWVSSPGLPAISVPLGVYPEGTPVIDGLRELIDVAPGIPFGLSFLGKKWSEETLIRIAYAFEQATQPRASILPGLNATIPRTEIGDIMNGSYIDPSSPVTSTVGIITPTAVTSGAGAAWISSCMMILLSTVIVLFR